MPTMPSPGPPQQSPGGNNGGNGFGGGGGGDNSGPSLASSASLYLYTFLATLVLLLSVSAAIVVRSFLLRRRHRRMIEEAIRNGTWLPPPPGSGRGGPRVDLSKKPRMWEVYLDMNGQHQQHPPVMMPMMDERDWESIKPVMATYVHDQTGKKKSSSNQSDGSGAGVTGGAGTERAGDGESSASGTGSRSRGLFRRFASRIGRAISPSPSGPQFGQSPSPAAGNNTRHGSSTNISSGQQDMQMTELGGSNGPQKVRVAVLIAMPRPHTTSPSASQTISPSTSRSASSGSTPPLKLPQSTTTMDDEEEELPHIEMGVAELAVTESSGSTSLDGVSSSAHHHPLHDAKGKVRESMASMGSV